MKNTFNWKTKWFTVITSYSNTRELQILCDIGVGSNLVERPFSCTKHINNWFRNSMLIDLSNPYVSIHARKKMKSSLIGHCFMKYLHIFIYWDYDNDIWFLQNSNRLLVVLVVKLLFSLHCMNCETIWNLSCWWLFCTAWHFNHGFDLI